MGDEARDATLKKLFNVFSLSNHHIVILGRILARFLYSQKQKGAESFGLSGRHFLRGSGAQ